MTGNNLVGSLPMDLTGLTALTYVPAFVQVVTSRWWAVVMSVVGSGIGSRAHVLCLHVLERTYPPPTRPGPSRNPMSRMFVSSPCTPLGVALCPHTSPRLACLPTSQGLLCGSEPSYRNDPERVCGAVEPRVSTTWHGWWSCRAWPFDALSKGGHCALPLGAAVSMYRWQPRCVPVVVLGQVFLDAWIHSLPSCVIGQGIGPSTERLVWYSPDLHVYTIIYVSGSRPLS